MVKRRWSERTIGERVAIVVLTIAQVSLAVAAWADLSRRPSERVNGAKAKWAAIIGINFIGPIAYFRWGRRSV